MLSSRAARSEKAVTRGPDLRESILDCARRILLRDGVDQITARRIAAGAGCSATAIYFHYENLDDVLFALRMEGHALLATYLKRSQKPGAGTFARLRAMGQAYFSFGLEHLQYYNIMFLARVSRDPKREEVQQEISTLMILHDVVAAGIGNGDIARRSDPMVVTNAIWAQIHGVTSLAVQRLLVHTAPRGNEEVLEELLESVERALSR
jgi:AcrR family transcriptional regulator